MKRPGNFTILLFALLSFILVPPFFQGNDAVSAFVLPFLMSVVLLVALNIFRQSSREFFAACAFAIPALIGRWLLQFAHVGGLMVLVLICWILFLAFTVFIILRHILITQRVTYDTISGAICGYLLFGMMYAFVYAIIDFFYPGSLTVSAARTGALRSNLHMSQGFGGYVYFSFVTLATLVTETSYRSAPPRVLFQRSKESRDNSI